VVGGYGPSSFVADNGTYEQYVLELDFGGGLVFVQQRLCPKDLPEYHLSRTKKALRFVALVAGRMLWMQMMQ
jgi:hypothetical protein